MKFDVETLAEHTVTGIIFIVILGVFYVLSLLTKNITKQLLKRVTRYVGFFANAVQLLTILSGVIVAVKLTNLDSTILLAMLAILTAGVALSIDSSIKDVLAGCKIILFGYFKVGDYVSFDDIKGLVLDINLFSTSLNVQPKGLVVVSNSKIVDGVVTNHSKLTSVRYYITIPVYGHHDRITIRNSILTIVNKHRDTLNGASRVFHRWDGETELYHIQIEVKEYEKREEVTSDVSIVVTEFLEGKGLLNKEGS